MGFSIGFGMDFVWILYGFCMSFSMHTGFLWVLV